MSQALHHLRRWLGRLKPWHPLLIALVLQAGFLGVFIMQQHSPGHTLTDGHQSELMIVVLGAFLMLLLVGLFTRQQIWHAQSEERVRRRLLDVINALPDPSALRDANGRYVLWNRASEDYHGIKAKHVVGKTPFDIFPPAVAESILMLDVEVMRSGHPVVQRLELPPLYGKSGRVAMIHVGPVSRLDDPAHQRGAVTILHDVTQVERDATDLRNANIQLRMVLAASGFGSWTWDLHDNSILYSREYEALLHYKGNSFQKDYDFASRLHPSDRDHVLQAGAHSIRDDIPFNQVYRLQCFDGEYRSFHASGEPMQDRSGRRYFTGLLCPLDKIAP
jgi:PAS domain S-box-containing protein